MAGVTVLDAVERWCLHVMRMVQSCSDSDRDTISDLSEMSEEVQLQAPSSVSRPLQAVLRVTTFKLKV